MCEESKLSTLLHWQLWRSILLGQFLALLLCGSGVTSQLLQKNYQISMPTAQSFLNYVMLCLIFTTWLACKPDDRGLVAVLRKRGWKYFIVAAVDVEANFLVVKAFQYTTFTSIELLDCFSIPVVLLLSWLCIKVRYGVSHVMGVCLALVGIGCLVYEDAEQGREQLEAKDRFFGDMLCISGAALYGVSNVAQEYVVKKHSIVEFLGMLGLFGSIVNGIQLAILEKEQVSSLQLGRWEEISLLLAFSACLLLLYISMPLVLQVSSSTAVNISLLTTDFYSLIIGIYLFHYTFNWLYLLSFCFIIIGVAVYNLRQAPSLIDTDPSDRSHPESFEDVSSNHSSDCQAIGSNQPLTQTSVPCYNSYASNVAFQPSPDPVHKIGVNAPVQRRSTHGHVMLTAPAQYSNFQSCRPIESSAQLHKCLPAEKQETIIRVAMGGRLREDYL